MDAVDETVVVIDVDGEVVATIMPLCTAELNRFDQVIDADGDMYASILYSSDASSGSDTVSSISAVPVAVLSIDTVLIARITVPRFSCTRRDSATVAPDEYSSPTTMDDVNGARVSGAVVKANVSGTAVNVGEVEAVEVNEDEGVEDGDVVVVVVTDDVFVDDFWTSCFC